MNEFESEMDISSARLESMNDEEMNESIGNYTPFRWSLLNDQNGLNDKT